MRTFSFLSSKRSIITHFTRNPHLLTRIPPPIPPPLLHRGIHGVPSTSQTPESFIPPPSKILQSNTNPIRSSDEEDEPMNEFLSRFVWAIRGKLSEAYPGIGRDTLYGMLLVICQKVVEEMDHPGGAPREPGDSGTDLSPDLWNTIWEVSSSVHEAMRRDGIREDMKKYLHCDEVKEMCRFAGDVGIRGNLLRELRFKWARDKLEEVNFYRSLEVMREQDRARKGEGVEKVTDGVLEVGGEEASVGEVVDEGEKTAQLTSLPQRKGKIKYKIYGLDLSDPKWAEVAEKAEEAEKLIAPEEAQPVVGRCKKVDDKILALDATKDDLITLVLEEWVEILQPKRVDWLALLDRIKEHNLDLYFKVSELLLTEESFETNIRDYSKLMDLHSKAEHVQDAERILEKMRGSGIVPDVLTLMVLVHMYSKAGDLDRAEDAFRSLRLQGFLPDLKIYNSMITAYVEAGLLTQGETLIREMESKNINPTKEMYMSLLRAFAERGKPDGAMRMVNTMQFAGIQPTLESFTLIVEAHGQAGFPDKARDHFNNMASWGYRPDDRCTASMMAAYGKKNLLDKAMYLLASLEDDGFKPGVATYAVMADWLARLQLVDEAERMVSMMGGAADVPFEIHVSLCDMYSRGGEEEKARKSLRVLEGRKESLRGGQFERIVTGLVAGGMVEDAKRMYDVMVNERGFSPSEPLRVAVMTARSIPWQKPATRKGKRF